MLPPIDSAPNTALNATKLTKTAQAFEASFVKEMLAATDLGKSANSSRDEFRTFLLDAYATRIVDKGGFGLAQAIMHSLEGRSK